MSSAHPVQTRARRATAKAPTTSTRALRRKPPSASDESRVLANIERAGDELYAQMAREIESRFKEECGARAALFLFNTRWLPYLTGPHTGTPIEHIQKTALLLRFTTRKTNYDRWRAYYAALDAFNGAGGLLSSIPQDMPFRVQTANTLYHMVRRDGDARGNIQVSTPYSKAPRAIKERAWGVFAGSVEVCGTREEDMPACWLQAGKRMHMELFTADDKNQVITSPVVAVFPYLGNDTAQ